MIKRVVMTVLLFAVSASSAELPVPKEGLLIPKSGVDQEQRSKVGCGKQCTGRLPTVDDGRADWRVNFSLDRGSRANKMHGERQSNS